MKAKEKGTYVSKNPKSILTRYVYGTKINGTNEAGIIDLETQKVLCLCPEENAKLILSALEFKQFTTQL